MNTEQKARLNRLIKTSSELWNNPVNKIISVTDTLFIVFYKDGHNQVIKINKMGVVSMPEYKTVYHFELKPEVS